MMLAARVTDWAMEPLAAMMRSPGSMGFDFLHPAGEPALVGPDSVSWRIFKNPVTLFIGGLTAVPVWEFLKRIGPKPYRPGAA